MTARELVAGLTRHGDHGVYADADDLELRISAAIEAAVAEEREACAVVAESTRGRIEESLDAATSIRARGQLGAAPTRQEEWRAWMAQKDGTVVTAESLREAAATTKLVPPLCDHVPIQVGPKTGLCGTCGKILMDEAEPSPAFVIPDHLG